MSLSDHPIHHINSAFILAGGKGERLGILSKKIQKCMLRYAEYPLLEHLIRKFKSVGVEKIVLILDHLSSKTIDYFKDGKEWEIDIKYVNKYYASTSLALSENLDMMDDYFFYCHGNIYFEHNLLNQLLNEYNKCPKTIITVVNHSKLNHIQIHRMKGTFIESLNSENTSNSNLVFLGLGIYKQETVSKYLVPKYNKMTEEYLKHAIKNKEKIIGVIYNGKWFHIQDQNDLKKNGIQLG